MNIYFTLIAGTAGMCVLAGGIILFTVVYRKRLAEQQIRLKESELKHQRELLQSTITAQENERRRVAADLHDEVGSMLATIRLSLSQAESENDHQLKQERLAEIKTLLDAASSSARRISHDLMPPVLETFGLSAALEDLFEKGNTAGMKITYELNGVTGTGNRSKDLAIYRIVQELYSNTIRHAGATAIDVELKMNDNELHLNYSDNGKGFGFTGKENGGIGMRNIESRLSPLNGMITYTNGSVGMRAAMSIPLDPENG